MTGLVYVQFDPRGNTRRASAEDQSKLHACKLFSFSPYLIVSVALLPNPVKEDSGRVLNANVSTSLLFCRNRAKAEHIAKTWSTAKLRFEKAEEPEIPKYLYVVLPDEITMEQALSWMQDAGYRGIS